MLACVYLYLTCKIKTFFLGGGGVDWIKWHCICTHEEWPRGITIQKWNWLGWMGKRWPKGEHLGGEFRVQLMSTLLLSPNAVQDGKSLVMQDEGLLRKCA